MSIRKGRLTSQGLTAAPVNFPPGTLIDFAGATAPQGWLMCDGSAISRTEYAALFAAIGTAHGVGDGSTTFNLPDLRGEFRRGLDNMGTSAGARGKDVDGTGRSVGQGQADAMQGHFHDFYVGNTSSTFAHTNSNNQIAKADNAGGRALESTVDGSKDIINSPKNDGANGTPRTSNETRPTNVAFPVAIKY